MDWSNDLDVSSKKLIPRLGRRAHHEEKNNDSDQFDNSDSPPLTSGKSSAKPATNNNAPVAPPRARKTGWGDELKSAKTVKNNSSFQQYRATNNSNVNEYDIPVIPDLDEIIEDTGTLDISDAPPVGSNKTAAAYKELDTELVKSHLLNVFDNVDLSLLTEKLYPENLVKESDEVWSWESLFTQIASEINSESQAKLEEH
ncbi:intraflagellar transport protein 43 homolog isoform X1 [Trichogramma pretiosum]|uniref:intraflagellar transport protein 43 homolog isoform X1 n=1 Tax=Trichogramma pretiosum TaxID=7493 RepID=UPI0006C98DF8|nr:intraflagellar transport protein 43 homolog isoform X1 [Trichogramma pretiosum]